MKVAELVEILHAWAPPALAESYDNPGQLTGEPNQDVSGVLVSLDCTEAVIDEAIHLGCNVIISHHPVWFGARKRLISDDWVARVLIRAIKHDIALVAIHTNLDNIRTGVNHVIAQKLGLESTQILLPKPGSMLRMDVYVPVGHVEQVKNAVFQAGAGHIGQYDECSFSVAGTGTFRPLPGSNPFSGRQNIREMAEECRLEVVFPKAISGAVVRAMLGAHPYEEAAYQLVDIVNPVKDIGAGMIGNLPQPMGKYSFLSFVKQAFGCECLRYAEGSTEAIQRVAVCGGSGSFLLSHAMRAGADAFITGDITYHTFFDTGGRMMLLDIGHYESEQFTSDCIAQFLNEKFPTFAVRISTVITNPVKYF